VTNPGKVSNYLWFQDLLDIFASEYGWTKEEVLCLYPEEAEMLARRIRIRQARRELERLEALAPYIDRKDFRKIRSEILARIVEEDDHPKPKYKEHFSGEVRRKMEELDAEVEKRLRALKRRKVR